MAKIQKYSLIQPLGYHLYYNKVKNLYSGHDSLVIRPKTAEIKENKQTVYEVIKTKRGFFARLADAFRRQRTDTLSTVSTGLCARRVARSPTATAGCVRQSPPVCAKWHAVPCRLSA